MREPAARQTLQHDSPGFTLVEVMVAIVIIMVALMGLMEAVGVATLFNLKNQLRDEAVLIGEERMADSSRRTFDQMSTSFAPTFVPSRVRGTGRGYTVTRRKDVRSTVTLPDGITTTTCELYVQVAWAYKNISSNHQVRTLRVYKNGR